VTDDEPIISPGPKRRFSMECYPVGTVAALEAELLRLRTAVDEAGSALVRGLPSMCLNILLAASTLPAPRGEVLADLVAAALAWERAQGEALVQHVTDPNNEAWEAEVGRAMRQADERLGAAARRYRELMEGTKP
jgi:hypothetical protein